ncbi:MAG: iron ABC transporter permease [Tenuifilum sp.]|uniref:iron chelate uptake ABC transporter family permease subunit n=1 Tax=Tenuifilum sp. TaxID=2760880 RepID=UPI001B6D31C9|nr:iron ABC transporter permease [Bacteroidales bacterium]HOU73160.1 iron ABC transporter permease [Tenuifilum sp.]HQE53528.1 iron ABC transporter permease [Tenuifilum sp.]HQG71532.1 iron ABC transporter permease [Tenuifilum sp.]HQI87851.1 iron ABC transporter permease [Tenuifilum sp.]
MQGRTRYTILFISLMVVLLLLALLSLLLGSVAIPLADIKAYFLGGSFTDEVNLSIIQNFRMPKVVSALLAGSALAVSGLQMQTVFRNPLAGPYVLGISSGASLGVALVLMGSSAFGLSFWGSQVGTVVAALVGSLLVLMLILAVSIRVRDIMTLLILGMMFGTAVSAVTSLLQYFGSETSLKNFVIWTMGSLGGVGRQQLWLYAALVLLGLALAWAYVRPLNVLGIGDTYARSLGFNVKQTRFLIFLSTSLLAGAATAFNGPIAFVGIAVPHLARMVFRTSNHAILVPASALAGAATLLLCDIIAQLPGSATVLPLNSVASLMGIPVVIYIVLKNKRVVS